MHIALLLKVTYSIQILLKKIHILYCFSWKFTFLMSKVNFWIFDFIETKRINIDLVSSECSFPEKRKKKFVVNKV